MKKLLLTLTAAITCTSAVFATFPEEGKWYQLKNSLYPQHAGDAADIRDNSYLGYYPQTATDNVQWTIILESGGSAKAMGNNQYICGAENAFGDSSTATEAQKARQAWQFVYDEDHDGYYLVNKAFPDGAISGAIYGTNNTNGSRWKYEVDRNATGANICYFIITNLGTDDTPQCRLEIKNPASGVGKYMNIAANPQSYQLMRNDNADGGSLWIANVISEYLTADEQNALLSGKISRIKENAKNFIDLGIAPQTAITAWNNAVTVAGTTLSEEVISSLHTAYSDLVSAANTGYVKIRHAGNHPTEYVTVNENGVCVHSAATGKQALRLEPATTGFYLKNEYTNRYFKLNPTHDTTCLMVETTEQASKFEFLLNEDGVTVSVHEIGGGDSRYFHANQGTTVMPWNRGSNTNLNSCWYLEFVSADQASNEHYAGALALTANPSAPTTVGFYGIDQTKAPALAEKRTAADSATTSAEKYAAADAIWEAYNNMYSINMPQVGKIYTILNHDTSAKRGYLLFDGTNDFVSTSNKTNWGEDKITVPENATNHYWTLIQNDDQTETYLYNISAGKFANAYGKNIGGGGNYCWVFSNVPTPITIDCEEFSMPTDGITPHPMRILGGETTVNGRPAGMMIINGNSTPVPTTSGNSVADGNGFRFVEVGDYSGEEAEAAIAEVKEAAAEEYASAKTEAEAVKTAIADYNEEVHGVTVGHLTAEAAQAFTTALGDASVNHSDDYNLYRYNNALAAANAEGARIGLEHENVYTLVDSEGNHHHAIDGKQGTHTAAEKEAANVEEAYYNWICVNNGDNTVSFTHKHDDLTIKFAHGSGDKFTISYPAVGKVELKPVVATATVGENAPAPFTFTIMKAAGSSNTSAINELTAESASAAIYDLQGRRLNAPVKGINIIGGKKILVK